MLIVTPTRRGYITLSRSGRPELFPAVHGVCMTSNFEFRQGYARLVSVGAGGCSRRASASGGSRIGVAQAIGASGAVRRVEVRLAESAGSSTYEMELRCGL